MSKAIQIIRTDQKNQKILKINETNKGIDNCRFQTTQSHCKILSNKNKSENDILEKQKNAIDSTPNSYTCDSTSSCNNSSNDSTTIVDDSNDSHQLWEGEAGNSYSHLLTLVSSNSSLVASVVTSPAIQSIRLERAGSENNCETKFRSKSCDNLHSKKCILRSIRRKCLHRTSSDLKKPIEESGVEINDRNIKNSLFYLPKPDSEDGNVELSSPSNHHNHHSLDASNGESKKKRKFIIILKGVLKCSKKKKNTKESFSDKNNLDYTAATRKFWSSEGISVPSDDFKRPFVDLKCDKSFSNESEKDCEICFNDSFKSNSDNSTLKDNQVDEQQQKKKLKNFHLNNQSDKGHLPTEDETASTQDFLTLLYHESLVQRFGTLPQSNRCPVTCDESPPVSSIITGGLNTPRQEALPVITCEPADSRDVVENDSFDNELVQISFTKDDEGVVELPTLYSSSRSSSGSSSCSLLSSSSQNEAATPFGTNDCETNDDIGNDCLSLRSDISDELLQGDEAKYESDFNANKVDGVQRNEIISPYVLDSFTEKDQPLRPSLDQPEEANLTFRSISSSEESVIDSSDCETSDSSVDYDVTPIDDKYFDLHYDPYYYHGSYSLDDIPADQPIDYPSPYLVPSGTGDVNNDNWWQKFDGKPGRELYRSQSQPQNLGSSDTQPLDGNLPLHLFLSASQPLGKKFGIEPRSNSLENLNSRRRKEFGSLYSSFGSQLYTIKEEELEIEDPNCEEYFVNRFGSCINFGEENFVDYECTRDYFNSCDNFRTANYTEEPNYCNSSSHESFTDSFTAEGPRCSSPDEFYLLYSGNELSQNRLHDHESLTCLTVEEEQESSQVEESSFIVENEAEFGKMMDVYEEPFAAYQSSSITKRRSRSFPNLATEGVSSSLPDISEAVDFATTPSKKFDIPNKETSQYENVPHNSKLLNSSFFNGFIEKVSDDSNDSDYESNFNSDKYNMVPRGSDPCTNSLSSSDEFLPKCKSINSSGIFSLNLNSDFSYEDATPSCLTSGVPSFSAYSSDTSLDFDTFSKSSKVFKWNGSSSISDLTSLSKEFSSSRDGSLPTRASCSASDLISLNTNKGAVTEGNLATTSYMQWSANVGDDLDESIDEFPLPLNLRSTSSSSFVFTPHTQAKRNSLTTSFYSRSSDAFQESSDEGDESCDEVTSSSGSDSADDDGMMRSYHLGLGGPPLSQGMAALGLGGMSEIGLVLETIAEDVEEDSGGESSSGHWLFSADNTDTDSVIHVPSPFVIQPSLPTQYETERDNRQSSSSVDTLVASEEETTDKELRDKLNLFATKPTNKMLELDNPNLQNSSNILQVVDQTFESQPEEEFDSDNEGLSYDMNGPNPMDDIFDFSSLDTCEEVSMSYSVSLNKPVESLTTDEVVNSAVFNTSATSQPFTDLSAHSQTFVDNKIKPESSSEYAIEEPEFTSKNSIGGSIKKRESEEINSCDAFGLSHDWSFQNDGEIKLNENGIITPVNHQDSRPIENKCENAPQQSSDEELCAKNNIKNNQSKSPQEFSSSEEVKELDEGSPTEDYSSKQKRPQRLKLRSRNKLRKSTTHYEEDTDDTDGDFDEDDGFQLSEAELKDSSDEPIMDNASFIGTSHDAPDMKEGVASNSARLIASLASCVVEHPSENENAEDHIEHLISFVPLSDKNTEENYETQIEKCRGLTRPFSLGDLRYYSSDSEPEEDLVKKRGFSSDAKQMNVNSSSISGYASSYQTKYNQREQIRNDFNCDKSLRSPSKVVNNRPRRHQSMYNPVWNEQQETWQHISRDPKMHPLNKIRKNSGRPKPLSLDMAEEFLSQEGLNNTSPTLSPNVNSYNNPYAREPINMYLQHPNSSRNTNSVMNYEDMRDGSVQELQRKSPYFSTPDLTHEQSWLGAQKPLYDTPLPAASSPRCDKQPQFLSNSQNGRTRETCAGSRIPIVVNPHINSDYMIDNQYQSDENQFHNTIMRSQQEKNGSSPDKISEWGKNRVHTKTYGTHGQVEVYLEKSEPTSPNNFQGQSPPHILSGEDSKHGSRGVTFSPSVKEVNWRETYLDDTDFMFTQLEEKQVKRVKIISTESPVVKKLKTPQFTSFKAPQDCQINQLNGNNSNDALDPIDYNRLMESSPRHIISSSPVSCERSIPLQMDPTMRDNNSNAKSSSDEQPNSPTPIWQRLKLVKLGSPKGPRPKIPPKPPSLSPRSSDSEGPKASSPSSPESELSSPEFKFKKIPTSPKFFSWGSKREKKSKSSSSSSKTPKEENSSINQKIIENNNRNSSSSSLKARVVDEIEKSDKDSAKLSDRNICVTKNSENDFLKTRNSILKQIKTVSPKLNKFVTNDEIKTTTNGHNNLPGYYHSSDSDSVLDETLSSPPSVSKPPLPPTSQIKGTSHVLNKSRATHARRQYMSLPKTSYEEVKSSSTPDEGLISRPIPAPRSNVPSPLEDSTYRNRGKSASERLKERFERFSKATRAERERLARSTPDLSQMEESLRRSTRPRIDCSRVVSPHSSSDDDAAGLSSGTRALPLTREEVRSTSDRSSLRGINPNQSKFSRVSAEFERISQRNRTRSVGLLETDLDTGTLREFLTPQETNLDDLYQDLQHLLDNLPQGPLTSSATSAERTRAKSLLQLDAASECPQVMENNLTSTRSEDSRAKSMEFLLDDENRAAVQIPRNQIEIAPENELMKEGERKVSEAELRVRRSLQRLDVPEWMKTSSTPQQGFLLRRRDHTSTGASAGGWSGFSSRTGSMSSLSSSRANTPNTPTKVVIPTRASTRSYGGIVSPGSQASISPSPSDRGSLFTYPLSRWSTSRLNSGMTTPTGSFTSQRSLSYSRQPYLGWRSNTSLASLGATSQSSMTTGGSSSYLSPAERLALTMLPTQRPLSATPQDPQPIKDCKVEQTSSVGPVEARARVADVHSSIKEVTSAIVHYCNKGSSPRGSPNSSPRPSSPRRLVWVESSFVGAKPISSPQTPTSISTPINGHKEDARPPQPTEVFGLINIFSSAESSYMGNRSSLADNTNNSKIVLLDHSTDSSGIIVKDGHVTASEGIKTNFFSEQNSQSENSSRHSTADTINSALSSRGVDSLYSRNSDSMSRDSSTSRRSSTGKGENSSREELPVSAESFEDITDENSECLLVPLQSSNFLSLTDDSTLTASCHSSFGNFQIEEDIKPNESLAQQRAAKLDLEIESANLTTTTRQSINSRRFSEGASPWEPSSLLPYDKPSTRLEDTPETAAEDQGYGFNFSSYLSHSPLPVTEDPITIEEVRTETTTLEDVLDSLLALPSASRSPSPSGTPHPLSLVRPYTPHNFLTDSSSKQILPTDADLQRTDSSHSSFFMNQDLRSLDPKTETYHKSFNYATRTFASPSSKDPCNPTSQSSSKGVYSWDEETEKTSVTFYLGKDEGNSESTTVTDVYDARVSRERTPTSSAFVPNVFYSPFLKESQAPPMNTFSSSNERTEEYPNLPNQLDGDSCRTREPMEDRRSSVEDGILGQTKGFVPPSFASAALKSEAPTKETKVTFHLPHMNIPPDSSSENGNGSESLKMDIEDEDDAPSTSDQTSLMVHCRNNLCSNSGTVEEAKETYKTCHNCSVFYCSRYCRRIHWDKHKKMCEKIRGSTVARQIVDKIKDDLGLLESFSAVARRGILSTGRGAVKIFFANPESAEKFLTEEKLPPAHYQPLQNIMPQEMGSDVYKKIIEQCRCYNTDIKFILYVSICTYSEAPTVSSVKCRRETIAKCAKLRLVDSAAPSSVNITPKSPSKVDHHVITRDLNEPETLVFTTFPDSNYGLPPRQLREVAFRNIVRELQERGVNLRHQYGDVFRKLSHYVDVGGFFSPLTLYPKDQRKERSFMCIIMPEPDSSRLERLTSDGSKVRTIDISRPHAAVT